MELTNKEIHEAILNHKEKTSFKGIVTQMADINETNKTLRQKGLTVSISK